MKVVKPYLESNYDCSVSLYADGLVIGVSHDTCIPALRSCRLQCRQHSSLQASLYLVTGSKTPMCTCCMLCDALAGRWPRQLSRPKPQSWVTIILSIFCTPITHKKPTKPSYISGNKDCALPCLLACWHTLTDSYLYYLLLRRGSSWPHMTASGLCAADRPMMQQEVVAQHYQPACDGSAHYR